MDRTLKRAKRKNKRRGQRNVRGLAALLPGRDDLPLLQARRLRSTSASSGQPHFYRPATEAEKRDPSVMLYRHTPVSSTGQALPTRAAPPCWCANAWSSPTSAELDHRLLHRLRGEHRDSTRVLHLLPARSLARDIHTVRLVRIQVVGGAAEDYGRPPGREHALLQRRT